MELKGKFEGWCLNEENGIIIDSDGNEFTSDEIRALFYFRQWRAEFEGWNGRIISLKESLERKKKEIKLPEVHINWGNETEILKHPDLRK